MKAVLLALAAALALPAQAEVYRWVDEHGRVHYSNAVPPEGVEAVVIGATANGGFVSPPPAEGCYTLHCQGERLEPRLARREAAEARYAAERLAAMPPPPRGLSFRDYISLRRGMTEGELLGIAGAPDLQARQHSFATYTYMPTPADPFTTTITLVRGRVSEIERTRKF